MLAPYPASGFLGVVAPSMRWFYIQRVSAAASGSGTNMQYIGPFYGNTSLISPLMRSGDYILVYVNGEWTEP